MRWLTFLLMIALIIMPLNICAIEVNAGAAILLDAKTGYIYYEKNAYAKLPPASTTKIMTAILAIEHGNLDQLVTVSGNAQGVEGSSMYLKKGQKISLDSLIAGLMLVSGNDSAVAIAEHVGGSVDGFVKMMNDKAKEIGAKNTKFQNPHGLHHDQHYTTAYDLALIAKYAMNNPKFVKYSSAKSLKIDDKVLTNKNKLLRFYSDADGIKPGFTPEARRTLVGSATRNGNRVITVTLNCADDWNEHIKMFDYAFTNCVKQNVIVKYMQLGTVKIDGAIDFEVPIIAGDDFYVLNTQVKALSYIYNIPSSLQAPCQKGQEIGKIDIFEGEKLIGTVPIITNEDIKKTKVNTVFIDRIINLVGSMFGF